MNPANRSRLQRKLNWKFVVVVAATVYLATSYLMTGLSAQQPVNNPQPTKKVALLVGINDYADPSISDLRGAVNDVQGMKNALVTSYEFPPDNVTVLTDSQATRDAILTAFREKLINQADAQTVVVFHFSGHGSQVPDEPTEPREEPDQWDETIVPHDSSHSGDKENRDIIDDELGELFVQLRAKTEYITFIFDSCHSGDATKDIDQPRELARDTRPLPRRAGPSVANRDGPRDYAQISGCRANERSYEFTPSQGTTCGTLTYYLLQEINKPAKESEIVSYRDVMDRVTSAVTAEKPFQHPQAEGSGMDRQLFGIRRAESQPYILVTSSNMDSVEFNAGRVHGLTKGSQLDIYPPDTKKFDDLAGAVAHVRLSEVNPFTSKAVIEKIESGRSIEKFARAVIRVRQYENDPLRVFLDDTDASAAPTMIKLRERITAETFPIRVQLCGSGDTPRITVRKRGSVERMGKSRPERFAFVTGDGSELSWIAATDQQLVDKLGDGLATWANWYSVFDLKNPEGRQFAQLTVKKQNVAGDQGVTKFQEDEQVEFSVTNLTDGPVYFVLLDLSNDASIELIVSRGQNQPLAARQAWSVKTPAYIPPNDRRESIIDHLQLIVTQQPVDFSFLAQQGVKSADLLPRDLARDTNPFTKLLSQRRFGTKQILPPPVETDGWSTDRRTIEVTRR